MMRTHAILLTFVAAFSGCSLTVSGPPNPYAPTVHGPLECDESAPVRIALDGSGIVGAGAATAAFGDSTGDLAIGIGVGLAFGFAAIEGLLRTSDCRIARERQQRRSS